MYMLREKMPVLIKTGLFILFKIDYYLANKHSKYSN